MVSTQNRYATEIGYEILKKGGNAVDAAVAVGFALAVTLPRAGNLGGGGFILIYEKETQKVSSIDYRSAAPVAASAPGPGSARCSGAVQASTGLQLHPSAAER